MMELKKSPLTDEQIAVWLRGLLSIAWSDGHYDPEEQELIAAITQTELAPNVDFANLEPISTTELAAVLGQDDVIGQNFLRTAVMVALADGIYSPSEDELLHQLCVALGQKVDALDALRHTLEDGTAAKGKTASINLALPHPHLPQIDVLAPMRHWLDDLEIHDPRLARFLCKLIPPQCPFERNITLFGHKVVHIPPLCKLNPLYEQLVGIRFRALSYLADECGEDVREYC